MNWAVIIIVGVAVTALIFFLVQRNQKDERRFEKEMDSDFHKKDPEKETDAEENLK